MQSKIRVNLTWMVATYRAAVCNVQTNGTWNRRKYEVHTCNKLECQDFQIEKAVTENYPFTYLECVTTALYNIKDVDAC